MKSTIAAIMLTATSVANATSAVVCVDGATMTEVMSAMNWKLNQKFVFYPIAKELLGKEVEFQWIKTPKIVSAPSFSTVAKTITMCVTVTE